jgi:hypothetical protein
MSTARDILITVAAKTGLENREYGRRDLSRWPRGNLYPQKFALTSPTSGGLSAGIVRSRTKATEWQQRSAREGIEMPHN